MESVDQEIQRIVSILMRSQTNDGSWKYAFETGIITDAYTIILLRMFNINDEHFIQSLKDRILHKQTKEGVWKLFRDQPKGDLSSTILAYNALLFSGYIHQNDDCLKHAQAYILEEGGIDQAETFTKILLAITGQYDWSGIIQIPIEIMLFSQKSPLSFYDFSVFGRANLAPILILQQMKYQKKIIMTPDLTHLFVEEQSNRKEQKKSEWRNVLSTFQTQMEKMKDTPKKLKSRSIRAAEQYMLKRIEPDGTLLSYYSATFFMIVAFLALGYPVNHPLITKAIKGIFSMAQTVEGTTHMQYTTANVWNTSLISDTMQLAGIPYTNPSIAHANQYLLSKQQSLFGDWVLNNPTNMPGGWGFSNINTINPDVDDTTASLRAIRSLTAENPIYQSAWKRGLKWVLSMQNKDGGWPAFERGVNKKWLALAPIQGAEYLLLDPSTADLTGRTLEFLGNYTHLNKDHPAMKKGLKWLVDHQREDGSWYGRWGICYIYGTWAALTGMNACGRGLEDPNVQRAVNWLKSIQNIDGGWGESCNSDIQRKYVPLGESTLTHTAWAVDALVAVSNQPTKEINRGVQFLTSQGAKNDWTELYPKGQGMAAGFYIHYESYQYIWPLMALAHYKNKYGT